MLRRGGRGGERRRREKNRRVGRGIREKRRGGWGEETLFSSPLSSGDQQATARSPAHTQSANACPSHLVVAVKALSWLPAVARPLIRIPGLAGFLDVASPSVSACA